MGSKLIKTGVLHFLRGLAIWIVSSSVFAGSLSGMFRTETNDEGGYLHVEMVPCESDAKKACGLINKAFNVNEGPDPILDYEHLGKLIVWDMKDQGDGSWSKGKIWAPDDDKTYKSKMEINASGDVLTVEGCVLFICRGQDWKRLE